MASNMKWLIPVLAISLATNVFVAGMVLGKKIHHPVPSRPHGEPGIDFNFKLVGQYLSKDERQKVRKVMKDQRGGLSERYRLMKDSEQHVKNLISAEEVDRGALLTALEKHSELMQHMHEPMQRAMMEVIAELGQESRKKIAADMFKRKYLRRMRDGDYRSRREGAQ